MTVRDDDWPDQIEYDPRWEVQPEPDDDPGSNVRAALLAAVVLTFFVVSLVWLVLNTPPSF